MNNGPDADAADPAADACRRRPFALGEPPTAPGLPLVRGPRSYTHLPHNSPPVGCSELPTRVMAYWRPRLLRAAAFQRPQLILRSRVRRVPRWVVDLPQLSHCRAWLRYRGRPACRSQAGADAIIIGPLLDTASPLLTAHNPIRTYAHPHKVDHVQYCTSHRSRGCPGPKAGSSRLRSTLCWVLLHATAGARVSFTAAMEEGPAARPVSAAGKPSSTVQQGREHHFTRAAKRSYRRACHRATNSLQEGTWYKGRWHTRAALNALHNRPEIVPNPVRLRSTRGANLRAFRPEHHIRVLCWNAGGLSSPLLQEFLAWCETRQAMAEIDAIILVETHWKPVADYRSGHWLCIHSSGCIEGSEKDRYSCILCLLSGKCFSEPKVKDHAPGRLLQVVATHNRSQLPASIIGLYQHVWRPQLGAKQNRELRSSIWHQLQTVIAQTPSRHQLIIAGDFNATLKPMHPHVGPAAPNPSSHNNQDRELQALLREYNLCALNTWHAKPAFTFSSPTVKSQIDYILLRCADSNHRAKLAKPLHDFPVGAHRLSNHCPVQAAIPMLPMGFRPHKPQAAQQFQASDLQLAVASNSDTAQSLRQAVQQRLASLPDAEALSIEHDRVNSILMEETCKLFPHKKPSDSRISAHPEFRASAKHTWQLHKQFRRPGLLHLRNIWMRWKLYASFLRASALLRKQSKALKRQFLEDQLLQAEQAAKKGDHRGLFLVAKRLGPRSAQGVSRLQDSDGKPLDSKAEMAAIIKHSQALFAATPDTQPWHKKSGSLEFSATQLQVELDRLNIRKAVPRHTAPNAVWRLCSEAISQRLGPCFERHFAPDSADILEGDMKDAHICWLNKPSKHPTSMSALRPIGLMPPCAKSFAGAVATKILAHLRPLMDHLPQFAYCDGRGCGDAILRVHQHFEAVEQLLQGQTQTRFKMQQQIAPLRCFEGACFSLDLTSAFDMVSRDLLIQSLIDHWVPGVLINAVQQLHREARYVFRTPTQTGSIITTNGIKQGCRAAPTLWVSLTILILEHLIQKRSLDWVQRILTLFADDFCGCWLIRSTADFEQIIRDLALLIETLELFKLKINLQKTALLLHLKGKGARKLLEKYTFLKAGERYLRVSASGTERHVHIKASHTYLGTVIAYHNRKDLNLRHRISAAQARYQQIRKVLNGRGPISIKHRLRLWGACIPPCMLYSLEATDCTTQGLVKLKTLATRHLRAILKQPAHLSKVPNHEIWAQAGMVPPAESLRARLLHLCQRRDPAAAANGPDLVSNETVVQQFAALLAQLEGQIQALRSQEQHSTTEAQTDDSFPCAHCDLVFNTAHARTILSRRRTADRKLHSMLQITL